MEQIIEPTAQSSTETNTANEKFCKYCAGKIPHDAILCTLCGRQVEQMPNTPSGMPSVVINNTSSNVNTNQNNNNNSAIPYLRPKNKWVAIALCIVVGFLGAHKFYEGKTGIGILYLFTLGLFFIGPIIDFITLLFKPNPYYI